MRFLSFRSTREFDLRGSRHSPRLKHRSYESKIAPILASTLFRESGAGGETALGLGWKNWFRRILRASLAQRVQPAAPTNRWARTKMRSDECTPSSSSRRVPCVIAKGDGICKQGEGKRRQPIGSDRIASVGTIRGVEETRERVRLKGERKRKRTYALSPSAGKLSRNNRITACNERAEKQ